MKNILLILAFLSILPPLTGQESFNNDKKNSHFSILISKGYRIGDNSDEASNLGIEVQLRRRSGKKVGILIKSGWLKWPDNRETVIPLLLGLAYNMVDSKSILLSIYGAIGPQLTFGNDYAGVFAKHELGLQFSSATTGSLIIGISWGQDVVFHPSQYSVLKGSVGWMF